MHVRQWQQGYGISCPATQVRWRRIVLDEAHNIKDRQCSTAKAVFALASKYKWALSGTPLQNRVSESLRILSDVHTLSHILHSSLISHRSA